MLTRIVSQRRISLSPELVYFLKQITWPIFSFPYNSRYWIIILYFATSTGTSLKASPRVSSLDHCLYNCCQIAHSNLKCTTNFYSALAILPPLDPDRVFFSDHWSSPCQEEEWNRFKNAKMIREARLANTSTKSCDSLYWPTLPRCS